MKKLSLYLVTLFLILFKTSISFAYSSDPKTFILELVGDTIEKLSDKTLSIEQKSKFVEQIAIQNVDINALGLYTLGELRKSSNKNDIESYQKTFEKYFLKTLTSRLTDYSSSKFEVVGAEQKSSNYTIIQTKISPDDGSPEIKVDWRVYTKNPEKPLIRDLIVEGLSLARTQRRSFRQFLTQTIMISKL